MVATPLRHLLLCCMVLLVLAPYAAARQVDSNEDRRERARLIGILEGTELEVSFEGTPAREAFRAISRAIGVPITGRWADDRTGHGIDPEIEIWLEIDRADARLVLEIMIEQSEDYEPCTWQLRRGYIEVGTKERLAAPSARQTRLYPIRDFMLEPPYNVGPNLQSLTNNQGGGFGGVGGLGGGSPKMSALKLEEFMQRKYSTAVVSLPAQNVEMGPGGSMSFKKRPEEIALEMLHGIVETVEPGNWETGEIVEPDEDDQYDQRNASRGGSGRGSRASRTRARMVNSRKIASIHEFDGQMIISAPDFVHRQVMGYPDRIPAPRLTDEERIARSLKASSTDTIKIAVLPPAGETGP